MTGLNSAVGSLATQTGASWVKAVPFVGYGVSAAAIWHDLKSANKDYQTCMAGKD